jgi:uncharacterized short protein YbdD (DUF466 family)
MPDTFETKHVFLDTEVFKGQGFNYQSQVLERLAQLAESREVVIHLTSITVNEVKANIKQDVAEGLTALKQLKASHAARILIGFSDYLENTFRRKLNKDDVIPVLIEKFQSYCHRVRADILPVEDVSIEQVFEKYFNQTTPFSAGKKKEEFPDAFVVAILKKWCRQNGEKLYVISNDNDFVTAAEESDDLIPLRELDDFLAIVSAYQSIDRYEVAGNVLQSALEEIRGRIEQDFPDIGFFLDEEAGEVHDVKVKEVRIARWDVIDANDDQATYSLSVEIDYSADVSYAESSYEGFVVITGEDTLERTLETKVRVNIDLDIQHPDDYQLRQVKIEEQDVILSLWGDGYPYK